MLFGVAVILLVMGHGIQQVPMSDMAHCKVAATEINKASNWFVAVCVDTGAK